MSIVIAGLLILLGVLGAILPLLPGPPLALAGLILYGYVTDFAVVSVKVIVVFAALTLLSFLFDIAAPAVAAKGFKASRYGVIGALLGAVIGVMAGGPLGIIFGPFVGGFVGEYFNYYDSKKALRIAWGALLGIFFGVLIKIVVTLSMAGYFVYALLKG